ncbi:MAG: PEP-CTERM sorting domain-containing protein, partial [Burkholderiales bacterium]
PFGFLMDATVRCLYFDQITCNSVADFLHTVNVTDLQVFDSQNHLVPGVFVVAESGHNYNSPAAALIPEPSSLPLFWTGLLVAMGLLRRGGSTAVAATSESAPALT